VVVPCCVCPSAFPLRRTPTGAPVVTHDELVAYLVSKAPAGEVAVARLGFEGKDTVVYSTYRAAASGGTTGGGAASGDVTGGGADSGGESVSENTDAGAPGDAGTSEAADAGARYDAVTLEAAGAGANHDAGASEESMQALAERRVTLEVPTSGSLEVPTEVIATAGTLEALEVPTAGCRWGIMACGNISNDFATALRRVPDFTGGGRSNDGGGVSGGGGGGGIGPGGGGGSGSSGDASGDGGGGERGGQAAHRMVACASSSASRAAAFGARHGMAVQVDSIKPVLKAPMFSALEARI